MTLPDCDRQGLLVVTVTGAVRGPVFHRAYVCRVTLASLAPVVAAVLVSFGHDALCQVSQLL